MRPSHLTRDVFRSILANEPLISKACLRQSRIWRLRSNGVQWRNRAQRRHIFGFLTGMQAKRSDQIRARDRTLLTSKVIGDLIAAQKEHLRPPPRSEVAAVLRTFARTLSGDTPLTEYDVNFADTAIRYIGSQDESGEDKVIQAPLAREELHNLLLAVTAGAVKWPKLGIEAKELGDFVLGQLLQKHLLGNVPQQDQEFMKSEYAETYVELLAATGYGDEALKLVKKFSGPNKVESKLWMVLLHTIALQRREDKLIEYIDVMFNSDVYHRRPDLLGLLEKTATLDLVQPSKNLYTRLIDSEFQPGYKNMILMLEFCIRNKETVWGQTIFDSLSQEANRKAHRVAYLWPAARGKPAEEIIQSIEQRLSNDADPLPGRKALIIIHGLATYANVQKDPISAAKYLDLISKWDLTPNAITHLVEVEHNLTIGNIEAAVTAFQKLQDLPQTFKKPNSGLERSLDEDSDNAENVSLLNKLLRAVCIVDRPNYDLAMDVLDMLNEKTSTYEPSTVAALISIMLPRAEYQEIHDLLRSHHAVFSSEERDESRNVVAKFILDLQNDSMVAWHAYDMFRNVFADTSINLRGEMMKSFFARKRPDLACLVFGHMRQMKDPDYRPTANLYTECFKGIAANPDEKAIELIYNMLKLDVHVTPDTRLNTAIMLAWAEAGVSWKALVLFDDIRNSVEGPTMSSWAVAFRACEKFYPSGRPFAMQLMARMKRAGVEVTKEIYLNYLAAIAANIDYDGALDMIENMEHEIGITPDAETFATAYNSFNYLSQASDFELWAQETYPEIWEEVLQFEEGDPSPSTGARTFLLDSTIQI